MRARLKARLSSKFKGDVETLGLYRLRTVEFGVKATWPTPVVLAVYFLLARPSEIDQVPYTIFTVAAALGAIVVWRLPWERLVSMGYAEPFLYIWSFLDIVLISFAIAFTGGGESGLFPLFALTTLFFAVSYPRRSQVVLLAFTWICYGAALAYTGFNITPGRFFVHIGTLGVLTYLAGHLTRLIFHQMAANEAARSESERRAGLLALAADSAREMSLLGPSEILDAVVEAVRRLDFEVAAISMFDDDYITFRMERAHGLPEGYVTDTHPASSGLTGMTLRSGRTVMVDDYSSHRLSAEQLRTEGLRAAIASPIFSEGRIAGVLTGASREPRALTSQDVEVIELLAGQAGRALENALKFEAQRSAVERLEELDRLKSEFLTTVSHELRTPLTAIEGMGATLEKRWSDLDDAVRRELVARLNANARSLHEIITTLLDFSRVEAGRLEVHPDDINVRSLVEEVSDRLSDLAEKHTVQFDLEPGLILSADPILMERVIENLFSNAARHTPPGTTITLRSRYEQGRAMIAVSDDGPGIPEEELARLGERFFRGGDPNSRARGGTGLGLALIGEVLKLHDSSLEISSDIGVGSTFSFSLPGSIRLPEDGEAVDSKVGRVGDAR